MPDEKKSKVLLLVSGGPDSATLAKFIEQNKDGVEIHALYLRSGHPSDDREIESANEILRAVGGKLEIIDISQTVRALGSDRVLIHSEASIMPFGNIIVLSIASTYAIRIGAEEIYIALHADDAAESYEYTKPYLTKIDEIMHDAKENAARIITPFIDMTKKEVFSAGLKLGVDYSYTWSCIRGDDKHCGECGACRSRRLAFVQCEEKDPTEYVREPIAIESVNPNR